MSLSSSYNVLSSTFQNNVNNGDWRIIAIIGVTATGTLVTVAGRDGRQFAVVLTDIASSGASAILDGNLGVLKAYVTTATPVSSNPALNVRIITPTGGTGALGIVTQGNPPWAVNLRGSASGPTVVQSTPGNVTPLLILTTGLTNSPIVFSAPVANLLSMEISGNSTMTYGSGLAISPGRAVTVYAGGGAYSIYALGGNAGDIITAWVT